MADDPAPAPTPTPTPTPAPEAKWYSGYDAEVQNYITSRGLTDKEPAEAFLDAAKGHREAQAYIGVPKEQLLKLPKPDAPPEEWDEVWKRLGYSDKADDYKLEGLKRADGSDVDEAMKDFFRAQAKDLHLSPTAAAKLAEEAVKYLDGRQAEVDAAKKADAVKAAEQLRQSWGPNYEANMVIADRAYAAMAEAAGFTPERIKEAINKLGEAVGIADTMQMLLAVGQKLGEDRFVGGGGPSGHLGPRTSQEAIAKIAELKVDTNFVTRWLAGGTAEKKQMEDLHTLAYGTNA